MKKVIRLILCFIITCGMTACVSSSKHSKSTLEPSKDILGVWTSAHSVAVYEVGLVDGRMAVSGHSSFSGKQLQIVETSWDGDVLRFTSYMPSTDIQVIHENRLIAPGVMSSRIVEDKTGKAAEHVVIWTKSAL